MVITRLPGLASGPALERFLASLGVLGAWHRLEPRGLGAGVPVRHLSAVAPPGALPWIVLQCRDARRVVHTVARARAGLGRPAGIACLDSAGRTLVLSVALDGAPCLEISLDHPDAVAVGVLDRLPSLASRGALEGAAALAEWLATEPVGTRFFRAFRAAFERMRAALPPGPGPEECEVMALLQLTRVLFLYFVQSRGWLDGRLDFLAHHVDDCLARNRNLHRTVLQPLWFGTLNRPARMRGRAAARFGQVPFLNGGLFDVHPLERRWPAALPNTEWRAAFDGVFERFRFVDREGEGTAIGPDTLGRVFEGLMDPGLRRASGSFYTPAPMVRELVTTGVAAWVAQRERTTLDDARARLQRPEAPLRRALAGLTILDPAAGSGAFLLGAMELLADLSRAPGESLAQARRRVLARNLFGVDVNPAALRLAELRLWLAVIAREDAAAPGEVPPLPNLDAVVRQGDSLWSRLEGAVRPDPAAAARVREARGALVAASGPAKVRATALLRRAEEHAARAALAQAIAHAEHRIREVIEAARAPSLFHERHGLGHEGRRQLAAARRERATLRHAHRQLDRTGAIEHFDYAVHFADVMGAGGFGLIAGNPPWVRGEALPSHVRQRLAARYRWYGASGGRGYRNPADLAVAFVERGYELLRPDGVLALLVPAKVLHAGYAAPLRSGLGASATLHAVAELPPAGARAFDATVYPLALVAGKATPPASQQVHTTLDGTGPTTTQSVLAGPGPWILGSDRAVAVLHGLAARHSRLGARFRAQLGVKTGADRLFLTREPDIERMLLRRAVRGRDVRPQGLRTLVWLRWPCQDDGTPLPELPPRAAAWFERHAALLRRRADYRDGPPWRLFRTGAATAAHRVVWADIARSLVAVPLEGDDLIPLNTCYVVSAPCADTARHLACYLNTTWCRAISTRSAPVAAGGFRRFNARVVENLPWPHDPTPRLSLPVDPVLPTAQAERDECVAQWLDLTRDERDALAELAHAVG